MRARPRGIRNVVGAAVALALVIGCSSAAICSGDGGPETLIVDASAFASDHWELEVCLAPMERDGSFGSQRCAPMGSPTVGLTIHGEYPAVFGYSVAQVVQGSGFIYPEAGQGTHRMACEPGTTEIVLENS